MTDDKDYRPCPDCLPNPGYVWHAIGEQMTVRPCPACKGTGLVPVTPVETERDNMTKEFYTGDNT